MADEPRDPRPDEPTATEPANSAEDAVDDADEPARATVVMPDGTGVSVVESDDSTDPDRNPATVIEEPAKVMRIGGMIKKLLDEVRDAPLDEAARAHELLDSGEVFGKVLLVP